MLNENDIEFMQNTRREVVANRERLITLYYQSEPAYDPITGQPIGGGVKSEEVMSVVTEITSLFKMKRELVGGVEVMKGDIWFSVDLDKIIDFTDDVTGVNHRGIDYEVLAQDRKGIGTRNRIEFLGRRVT